MATTSVKTPAGRKVSRRQVQSWANRVATGKATKIGIEREVFGNDLSRGKRVTRLIESFGL